MVAKVRNLRTSYIDSQFHVVFNDLFQIIFSLGDNDMVIDTICNQLFESNWDVNAEDEFSVDGVLIYSPPLLDEVWLSEPEHQDRREKMHTQCHQHEEYQCIQFVVSHCPCLLLFLVLWLFQMMILVLILHLMLRCKN